MLTENFARIYLRKANKTLDTASEEIFNKIGISLNELKDVAFVHKSLFEKTEEQPPEQPQKAVKTYAISKRLIDLRTNPELLSIFIKTINEYQLELEFTILKTGISIKYNNNNIISFLRLVKYNNYIYGKLYFNTIQDSEEIETNREILYYKQYCYIKKINEIDILQIINKEFFKREIEKLKERNKRKINNRKRLLNDK